MATESESLRDIILKFSSAEESIRKILSSGEGLTTAQQSLAAARAELLATEERSTQTFAQARADLDAEQHRAITVLEETRKQLALDIDRAGSSIDDASSGIYGLTNELKDISRDLKDLISAWRAMGPESMRDRIESLERQSSHRERSTRVWLSVLSVVVAASAVLGLLI